MYVDLYRHHFDLFVKAYLVYLAMMGVVAGFVFKLEVQPLAKILLLTLALVASVLATAAWVTALSWANAFGRRVDAVCDKIGMERIPMFGSKVVLMLGTLGSLALTCAGAYMLYYRGNI